MTFDALFVRVSHSNANSASNIYVCLTSFGYVVASAIDGMLCVVFEEGGGGGEK